MVVQRTKTGWKKGPKPAVPAFDAGGWSGLRGLLVFVACCGLASLVVTVGAFSCEGKECWKKGDRRGS